VETTIPSFYTTTRSGPATVPPRQWTRQWGELGRDRYALVPSDAVLDELRLGDYPSREPALALVVDLAVLEVTPAIAEIIAAHVRHQLMLSDAAGDALHLAIASYHKCEILVTCNCQS